MRVLLDTQIFIWWDSEPERLPPSILAICEDSSNTLVLSIASVWEMQIKYQLGKLDLDHPIDRIIREHQRMNLLELLPVHLHHVIDLQNLPMHHKDPFDRLIIAQTRTEQLTLLSVDNIFAQYPVALVSG